MDGHDAIRRLTNLAGIFEVSEVHTFQCYRNRKDGSIQEVEVKIMDAGPDANAGTRYSVVATSEDGKAASGNSPESVQTALAILHWYDLDR
ncbi:MAG: hypothetical protein WKF67_08365 [Rubrobacteraceae bacterium]